MHAVDATLQFGQAPVPAAEQVLHQAILSSQIQLTLRGHSRCGQRGLEPGRKAPGDGEWGPTVKVWDVASGRELLTLQGHTGFVLSVAWSPDGKRLATAESRTARRRCGTRPAGKELLTLSGHAGRCEQCGLEPGREAAGDRECRTRRRRCGTRLAGGNC